MTGAALAGAELGHRSVPGQRWFGEAEAAAGGLPGLGRVGGVGAGVEVAGRRMGRGPTGVGTGTTSSQTAMASGQRGAKGQPGRGPARSGGAPGTAVGAVVAM